MMCLLALQWLSPCCVQVPCLVLHFVCMCVALTLCCVLVCAVCRVLCCAPLQQADTITFLKAVIAEGDADHLPNHVRAYRIGELVKQKE